MNFICGPNGVGKTTLLECVAHSFSFSRANILKRNISSDQGSFKSVVEVDGQDAQTDIYIVDFYPNKPSLVNNLRQYSSKILSLKVSRSFQYQGG